MDDGGGAAWGGERQGGAATTAAAAWVYMLYAATAGRAIHRRGGDWGSSPRTSMQQQHQAPALVTPGPCRWAPCPFLVQEEAQSEGPERKQSSIGSETKSAEATS